MPVTAAELESFRRFVQRGLQNGGFESMEACLVQWRQEQETLETVADVEQGAADIAAGRWRTFEDVDADLRSAVTRQSFSVCPRP